MSPATFAALIELQRMRARFANCAEHKGWSIVLRNAAKRAEVAA